MTWFFDSLYLPFRTVVIVLTQWTWNTWISIHLHTKYYTIQSWTNVVFYSNQHDIMGDTVKSTYLWN